MIILYHLSNNKQLKKLIPHQQKNKKRPIGIYLTSFKNIPTWAANLPGDNFYIYKVVLQDDALVYFGNDNFSSTKYKKTKIKNIDLSKTENLSTQIILQQSIPCEYCGNIFWKDNKWVWMFNDQLIFYIIKNNYTNKNQWISNNDYNS